MQKRRTEDRLNTREARHESNLVSTSLRETRKTNADSNDSSDRGQTHKNLTREA